MKKLLLSLMMVVGAALVSTWTSYWSTTATGSVSRCG